MSDDYFSSEDMEVLAFAGLCICSYQGIEDYLAKVFSISLGGPEKRAMDIYELVQGLDRRLKLIKSMVSIKSPDTIVMWDKLSAKIKHAFDNRNVIAHSTIVSFGNLSVVRNMYGGADVFQISPEIKLCKTTSATEHVWTVDRLKVEYNANNELFSEVQMFSKTLKRQFNPPTRPISG